MGQGEQNAADNKTQKPKIESREGNKTQDSVFRHNDKYLEADQERMGRPDLDVLK